MSPTCWYKKLILLSIFLAVCVSPFCKACCTPLIKILVLASIDLKPSAAPEKISKFVFLVCILTIWNISGSNKSKDFCLPTMCPKLGSKLVPLIKGIKVCMYDMFTKSFWNLSIWDMFIFLKKSGFVFLISVKNSSVFSLTLDQLRSFTTSEVAFALNLSASSNAFITSLSGLICFMIDNCSSSLTTALLKLASWVLISVSPDFFTLFLSVEKYLANSDWDITSLFFK